MVWNSAVAEILGDKTVTGIRLQDAQTGKESILTTDAVFVAIGLDPDTGIFRDALRLDEAGYIAAGEDCKTNLRGVFVAGDNRSKPLRQIITAAADGAVAASQAIALINEEDWPPSTGPAGTRVFAPSGRKVDPQGPSSPGIEGVRMHISHSGGWYPIGTSRHPDGCGCAYDQSKDLMALGYSPAPSILHFGFFAELPPHDTTKRPRESVTLSRGHTLIHQ